MCNGVTLDGTLSRPTGAIHFDFRIVEIIDSNCRQSDSFRNARKPAKIFDSDWVKEIAAPALRLVSRNKAID
jgi:hypothetical protein